MESSCLTETRPLLTIAIPTWNRATFLMQTLEQLRQETVAIPNGHVEILVSDNCSSDDTSDVVHTFSESGIPLRYVRNERNIGSDANIAQCFNLAKSKFVLILGDDDLFTDGALRLVLNRLKREEYGVVCLKPYGFESDFRKEYPRSTKGKEREFQDISRFLTAISSLMTLISSCIINKDLLPEVDANELCGENLVQVHLVLQAALAAKKNLFLDYYLIACKRNNSGGYDFSQVFVSNLGSILDHHKIFGLTEQAIQSIEKRLILTYYPFYLLRQRLIDKKNTKPPTTLTIFETRFKKRLLFRLWLFPIIIWPRPLAIVWGGITTLIGRTLNGDLVRGIAFAYNRLSHR